MKHDLTRRRFLTTAGVSLVAAPLSGAAVPASARAATLAQTGQDTPARRLGYALVGIGSLTMNQILPAFARCQHARPVALVSGDAEKARRVGAQYGIPERSLYSYDTYDRIADNPDIDIVYVVLPNSMHAEYTIRALKAGKHVLCEKPMANTAQECEAMIGAAREAVRKLMVGYRLRYEPFNQAMIAMARNQEFGRTKVVLCDAGFSIGDPNQWRLKKALAGGGSMMDIGIYALNAARYLTGENPTEVFAMEHTTPGDPRFTEVEETLTFQLRFPSGVLANCTSSYGVGLNRFRVHAEKGSFELEPALSYSGLRMRVFRGNAVEERFLPQRDHFAAEMDHLAESIVKGTPILTPGEEGLADLRAIEAIYASARSGAPVKVAT
jgi:glucose-fructose oxidoreductase